MESVVSTPELVDMIFAHMSRKENATTALVCKSWLEHSRDHIWHLVPDPKALFRLLTPLKEDPELNFVRIPRPEDWQRFQPFARRVQIISFSKNVSMTSSMAFTLLRSNSRPNPILPNLRDLRWNLAGAPNESSSECVHTLFLHPGVRRLCLYNINKERLNYEVYPLRILFEDIAKLAPHIQHADAFIGSIVDLFSHLPTFQKLAIAPGLLTTSLLQSLSKREDIETIVPMFADMVWSCRDPWGPTGFYDPLTLHPGAFKVLKSLYFSAHIHVATQLLADENFPSAQLTNLRVRVLDCVSNSQVQGLLTVIATSCPSLRSLTLILYPPDFALQDPSARSLASLDGKTIEPSSPCDNT